MTRASNVVPGAPALSQQAGGHTPTPWSAEQNGGRGSWIKGATGEWAALSCGDTDASAEANAALIVRAVNSYAALVEATRDALSGWRYIREHHGDLYGVGWDRVENVLIAALAQSEAE